MNNDRRPPPRPRPSGPRPTRQRSRQACRGNSYGNSSLRFGLTPTSLKKGDSLGGVEDGWTHPLYTVTPGVPGDCLDYMYAHGGPGAVLEPGTEAFTPSALRT